MGDVGKNGKLTKPMLDSPNFEFCPKAHQSSNITKKSFKKRRGISKMTGVKTTVNSPSSK